MILYKYRGVSAYTEKIFTDKEVWLANAESLNDPFECTIQTIAADWIEQEVEKSMQHTMAGFVLSLIEGQKGNVPYYGLSPAEIEHVLMGLNILPKLRQQFLFYREFVKTMTGSYPADFKDAFEKFDQQLNQAGIFSLSEQPDNQLMWAHYGQESMGVVLGFEEESSSKLSDPLHCLKVNYSDKIPAFSGNEIFSESSLAIDKDGLVSEKRISFSDPTFKSAISTKPTVWAYENEWRYVERESGAYPWPGPLVEVVFGLKCTKENRQHYRDLALKYAGPDIRFYEMKKIPETNQMARVQI